jgi:hypothetical protein
LAWPCPTAADSDPKSDKPGATRTASPEAETHRTHNVCQVQFECLEITEAATQNQTSDRLPGKKLKSRSASRKHTILAVAPTIFGALGLRRRPDGRSGQRP